MDSLVAEGQVKQGTAADGVTAMYFFPSTVIGERNTAVHKIETSKSKQTTEAAFDLVSDAVKNLSWVAGKTAKPLPGGVGLVRVSILCNC